VNRFRACLVVLSSLILSTTATPQAGRTPGGPPLNGSHELRISDREMPPFQGRVDPASLQQEANDLATAARSIPADIESVRNGMLPKDVLQKLKQIEKLSKQLRNELNPIEFLLRRLL
jgi:hypothetical protein